MSYFSNRKLGSKEFQLNASGNSYSPVKYPKDLKDHQAEYSYEEYMCDQLTDYMEELYRFKNEVSKMTQELYIDIPSLKRHTRAQSQARERRVENRALKISNENRKANIRAPSVHRRQHRNSEQTKILLENRKTAQKYWVLMKLEKKERPKTQCANRKFGITSYKSPWLSELKEKAKKKSPYEITPLSVKSIRRKILAMSKERQLITPQNIGRMSYKSDGM